MKRAVLVWGEYGGGGKTTIATNTASALARDGESVLAIDIDPQEGGMTDHLGEAEARQRETHIGDALLPNESVNINDLIIDTGDFDLIPSHEGLANVPEAMALQSVTAREFALQRALQPVYDEYDYIIVDPQASLNVLVDCGIVATRNLMVPLEMTEKGRRSLQGLEKTIQSMEDGLGQIQDDFSVNLMALIPNKVGTDNLSEEVRKEVDDFPVTPFDIRKRSVLQDAWREGMTIFEYAEENRLRKYERDVLEVFENLATVVKEGSVPEDEEDVIIA